MCVFSFPPSDDGIVGPGAPPSAFIHTWLDHSDLDSMQSSTLDSTPPHKPFVWPQQNTSPPLIASQLHWDDIRADTSVEVRTAESLLIWTSRMPFAHLSHITALYMEARADLFSPVTAKLRTQFSVLSDFLILYFRPARQEIQICYHWHVSLFLLSDTTRDTLEV